jgi:hypothetical protein
VTDKETAARLVALASELASLAASLADREPPRPTAREPKPKDTWLSVSAVAARLNRSERWVYRRARSWPFCRKEGRTLMFSERGLADYFNGEA